MSRDRAFFVVRKLHSLSGIVPIGGFLLAHLYINSGALLGECAFTDGVRSINALPYVGYIEIFGILLPLAFHGVLGLWMAFVGARYNSLAYNYSRNWWYFVQRLSGVAIFAFLLFHLWDLWLAKELGHLGLGDFYGRLGQSMSSDMFYLGAMVVGSLAAAFHLSNGLWGFSASWGILQSRRAQRVGSFAFGLLGVGLAVAWLNVVVHFASGGENLIPVQEAPHECVTARAQPLDG